MKSSKNDDASKRHRRFSSKSVQSSSTLPSDGHTVECYKCGNVCDEMDLFQRKSKAYPDEAICPRCTQYIDVRAMRTVQVHTSEHQQRQFFTMTRRNGIVPIHSSYGMSKSVQYRYIKINAVKAMYNRTDTERYIISLAGLYNIWDSSKGREFINCLIKSIHDQQLEFTCDHSFTSESGETYYMLICVRTLSNRTEIGYSYQQISDESGIGGVDMGEKVFLSERKSEQWLKDKAFENLRIHTHVVRSFHTNRYRSNAPVYHPVARTRSE
ncbi:unnamed protein product [Adineta steineri]|uniref:Uncharacterized protein n=1 Tax=Adineta steineri TaxID=433720 RepID=A0A815A3K2_9BILA|nr:unnamed protein product [Adineta steineri]